MVRTQNRQMLTPATLLSFVWGNSPSTAGVPEDTAQAAAAPEAPAVAEGVPPAATGGEAPGGGRAWTLSRAAVGGAPQVGAAASGAGAQPRAVAGIDLALDNDATGELSGMYDNN